MSVRRPLRSARGSLPLVACSVVLVLLGGCAEDDPEPKIAAPSESPAPSRSPSGFPSPEGDPRDETPREFIQRWVDTDREMQNTGDTREQELISRQCEPCLKTIERIKAIYAAGGYIEWDGMEITKIRKIYTKSYDVWVTAAPTNYKSSESAPMERLKGGRTKYMLTLRRTDDGFVVEDLARRPL
jgi:hypothetical protein